MPKKNDPFEGLGQVSMPNTDKDKCPLTLDETIDNFRNRKEHNNKEYKIHCAIVEHHRTAFPMVGLIHIANQTRDATEAFHNKRMGVEPGVYDLLILSSVATADFVEIKAPEGYPSTSQKKFKGRLDAKGFRNGIVKSVRQYHELLKSWGHHAVHDFIKEPDLRTSGEKQADHMDNLKIMYGMPFKKD